MVIVDRGYMENGREMIDKIKALNGKEFAMLSSEEREVFDFFERQGRKYGVSITFDSNADPQALACASHAQKFEIYRRANSVISVIVDEAVFDAFAYNYPKTQTGAEMFAQVNMKLLGMPADVVCDIKGDPSMRHTPTAPTRPEDKSGGSQ